MLRIRLGFGLRLGVGIGWCRMYFGEVLLFGDEVGDLIRFGFGLELGF